MMFPCLAKIGHADFPNVFHTLSQWVSSVSVFLNISFNSFYVKQVKIKARLLQVPRAVAPATNRAPGLSDQALCSCFRLVGTIQVVRPNVIQSWSSGCHFYKTFTSWIKKILFILNLLIKISLLKERIMLKLSTLLVFELIILIRILRIFTIPSVPAGK